MADFTLIFNWDHPGAEQQLLRQCTLLGHLRVGRTGEERPALWARFEPPVPEGWFDDSDGNPVAICNEVVLVESTGQGRIEDLVDGPARRVNVFAYSIVDRDAVASGLTTWGALGTAPPYSVASRA